MNALRAPLTALSAPREECFHFLLDHADVVMDEIFANDGQVSQSPTCRANWVIK